MDQSEAEHRRSIVEVGKLAYQKGWVAANDGNISIRLDSHRILATPTGVSKGMMESDDLIIVARCATRGCAQLDPRSRSLLLTVHGIERTVGCCRGLYRRALCSCDGCGRWFV